MLNYVKIDTFVSRAIFIVGFMTLAFLFIFKNKDVALILCGANGFLVLSKCLLIHSYNKKKRENK